MANSPKPEKNHFFVDNKKFETDRTSMKGAEIKALATVAGNYQLFLEEPGNAPDRVISDGEDLMLDGPPKHFYSVPPATFGS